MSTELAKADKAPVAMTDRGVKLSDLPALWRFAELVAQSGFAPKGMNAQGIAIAIQLGLEIGLSPMQALQSTAVINGRPGIYGDAAKALVEASGLMEDYDQYFTVGDKRVEIPPAKLPDDFAAVVVSKRTGRRALTTVFSVGEAKAAGLWGKAGPWVQYPARMLMFRARGFNLRDNFGDVLKGLRTAEELADMPPVVVETTDAKPGVAGLAERLTKRAEPSADHPGGMLFEGAERVEA